MAATSGASGSSNAGGGGSKAGGSSSSGSGGGGSGSSAGKSSTASGSKPANSAAPVKPESSGSNAGKAPAPASASKNTAANGTAAASGGSGNGSSNTGVGTSPNTEAAKSAALQAASKGVTAGMDAKDAKANGTPAAGVGASSSGAYQAAVQQAKERAPAPSPTAPKGAPPAAPAPAPTNTTAVAPAPKGAPPAAPAPAATNTTAMGPAPAPAPAQILAAARNTTNWTPQSVVQTVNAATTMASRLSPQVGNRINAHLNSMNPNGTLSPAQVAQVHQQAVDNAMSSAGLPVTGSDVANTLNSARTSQAYNQTLNSFQSQQQRQNFENTITSATAFFNPKAVATAEVIDAMRNPTNPINTTRTNVNQTVLNQAQQQGVMNSPVTLDAQQQGDLAAVTAQSAFSVIRTAGAAVSKFGSAVANMQPNMQAAAQQVMTEQLTSRFAQLAEVSRGTMTAQQWGEAAAQGIAATMNDQNFQREVARIAGMSPINTVREWGQATAAFLADKGIAGIGAVGSLATRAVRLSGVGGSLDTTSRRQTIAAAVGDVGVISEVLTSNKPLGNAMTSLATRMQAGPDSGFLSRAASNVANGLAAVTATPGQPVSTWLKIAQNAGGPANILYGGNNLVSAVRAAMSGNNAAAGAYAVAGAGELAHGIVQIGQNFGTQRSMDAFNRYNNVIGGLARTGITGAYIALANQAARGQLTSGSDVVGEAGSRNDPWN